MRWVLFCAVSLLVIFLLWIFLARKAKEHKAQNMKSMIPLYLSNIRLYNEHLGERHRFSHPIYYINLDKNVDRRRSTEEQLSKISQDYTRVPGVLGSLITNLKKGEIQGVKFVNRYSKLKKAEIGCTLAHLMAIKTARDAGHEMALICEDDIYVDSYSITLTIDELLARAPHDWEMLKLAVGGIEITGDPTSPTFISLDDEPDAWSNAAYLINRRGMDKILSVSGSNPFKLAPFGTNPLLKPPTGGVADKFIPGLMQTYIVMPPMFGFITSLPSTIHQDHVDLVHLPFQYQFLHMLNDRVLHQMPWKMHLCKSYDDAFSRKVWEMPVTGEMSDANLVISNVLCDNQQIAKAKGFRVIIDREPWNVSDRRHGDLIISTKHPSSGFLPKNMPSMYLPCYSAAFAEQGLRPSVLLKPKKKPTKNKFCAFAYSNCDTGRYEGVRNRIDFFKLMQKITGDRVDSWGKCENNMTLPADSGQWKNHESYTPYKFVIAFENDYPDGYISEKLINPMLAGAIPIYLGDKSVGEHFNPRSFINVRDYPSWDACIKHVLELDADDEAYDAMFYQPWLKENKLTPHFSWWDPSLGDFYQQLTRYTPGVPNRSSRSVKPE
jgi:GR25 family glycosyltransferase involved in LPS biosynthesis